jgi:hypothetical protein
VHAVEEAKKKQQIVNAESDRGRKVKKKDFIVSFKEEDGDKEAGEKK